MNTMGVIVNSHTVRIERLLPGPIDRVWEYFTKPEYVSTWLMECTLEPKLQGLISLRSEPIPEGTIENDQVEPHVTMIRGLISEFNPPRLIAFSWYQHEYGAATNLRVELDQRGDQVLVVLTHSHLDPEFMAAVAAGWHANFEALIALIRGEEKPDIYPLFEKLLEEYRVVVASAGIVIVATAATPAMASELSNDAYKAVSAQKQQLLKKYDSVWKDADRISNDITLLERASERDNKSLDVLYRDLNEKKETLRNIELDVRDMDKVLI